MDIDGAVRDLCLFKGGVVDTSTLIYLDKLCLLDSAPALFKLKVIPQVQGEYGGSLPDGYYLVDAPAGPADEVICYVAHRLGSAVLSEDREVLLAARHLGLPHLNTLMLLIAMYQRGRLSRERYEALADKMHSFARYNKAVYAFAHDVFLTINGDCSGKIVSSESFVLKRNKLKVDKAAESEKIEHEG